MAVHTEGDAGTGLAALKLYDWMPGLVPALKDPRLDPAMIDKRIRGAVDAELAARGYEKAGSRPPQLLVAYHLAMERRVDRVQIDHVQGYGAGRGTPVAGSQMAASYEQGTLILDLLDPASQRLLWRGSAQGQIIPDLDPAERQQRINEAVRRILDRLPRGK
jgi:hypothetical protein